MHGGYRFFTDTWGIDANTFEAGLYASDGPVDLRGRLPLLHAGQRRLLQRPVRPRRTSRTSWRATRSCRPSSARRCSVGATYDFLPSGWRFIKKGTLNIRYDRIEFEYEDFRDARFALLPASDPNFRAAGTEPLYTFGANVIQAFVSVWF